MVTSFEDRTESVNFQSAQTPGRPAFWMTLVSVLLLVIYYNFATQSTHYWLFAVFALSPLIPAVLLENSWIGRVQRNAENSRMMYKIIGRYRVLFIFAGIISSFVIILMSFPLRIMILRDEEGNASNDTLSEINRFEADVLTLVILIVLSIFTGVLTAASFYRIRAEEPFTGERYTFISSPGQIATLSAYGFLGTNFTLTVLWLAYRFQFANTPEGNLDLPMHHVSFGLYPIFFLIFASFFLAIIISAKYIPYLIHGASYVNPSPNQMRKWTTLGLSFVALIAIASYLALDFENGALGVESKFYLHGATVIGLPLIIFLIASSYRKNGRVCPNCNLLQVRNKCLSCERIDHQGITFKFDFGKKIHHPRCPSCDVFWEDISRKCYNCGFTIILSCEKCGQTLNPLWTKCNNCGIERKTIPELALESSGSPDYARSLASLSLLIAFLVPALILQVNITRRSVQLYDDRGFRNEDILRFSYDDFGRMLLLSLIIFCTVSFIILSFNDKMRPMMLLANKFAVAPGTIFVQAIAILFLTTSFASIDGFQLDLILPQLIIIGVSLIMIYFTFRSYINSLMQFRPVIGFDPNLSRRTS